MNILVIDTATEACSVALRFNKQVFSRFEVCPQQHSQKILAMVDDVLSEANATLNDVNVLGFGRGPGSFTGVRIATGIIQGLALGTALPVVGVSTLQAMAQQLIVEQQASNVAVAIDARMGEVYFACYRNAGGIATQLEKECVAKPEDVVKRVPTAITSYAGSGWQAYSALGAISTDNIDVLFPCAQYMLALVDNAYLQGDIMTAESIVPVYLRDTVTWKKLPGRE